MAREIFSPLTERLPYVWNCNTVYFVLWSYCSKTSWLVLCWNILASTQNIINNQWPHILFNWFPTVKSSQFRTHSLFCPRKETWPIWALQMVTSASPKFNFTYFSHNYHNYSMFRDVPEYSGMFHVPDFIDAQCKYAKTLAKIQVTAIFFKDVRAQKLSTHRFFKTWTDGRKW